MAAGSPTARRAFTLLELLLVAAIVIVLVAMFGPAVGRVYDVCIQTQCARRLRDQWQAQGLYRGDHDGQFATGMSWPRLVVPYLEDVEGTFVCPGVAAGVARERPVIVISRVHEFSLKFFDRHDRFLFELVVDESLACVRKTSLAGGSYALGIEDYHILELSPPDPDWRGEVPSGYLSERDPFGQAGWDDIGFTVRVDGGRPVGLEVWGERESLLHHARVDLYIDGELAVERAWQRRGAFIDLDEKFRQTLGMPTDYGMNLGTYEQAGGAAAPMADGSLFFILDYPKPLADYNGSGGEDPWARFFIVDPSEWPYRRQLKEGETWESYQSLRHSGRANVLFLDGHVEAVGVTALDATPREILAGKYLDETSPRWRHGARR